MMLKPSASRNQRSSKGLNLKQALQIFVLVAISIWLLYQVKKSYHNKNIMEEKPGLENGENEHRILKIGRKDLRTRIDEVAEKNGNEEVELEDEENKAREIEEEEGSEEMDKERSEEAENDQFQDFIDEEDKDA